MKSIFLRFVILGLVCIVGTTPKTEHGYQQKYTTREEAKRSLFEYIEVFYNRQRAHCFLGYLSPQEFE